jgi:tetratricopeptide (TPR) repeat protein
VNLSLSVRLALVLSVAMAVPAAADGTAGPYLAGRYATQSADYRNAADYFTRALLAEPANPAFLENAIVAQVNLGQVERAMPMAAQLDRLKIISQGANMVTFAALAKQGEYKAALAELDTGRSAGSLVDGLYRAWAMVGEGRMTDALAEFDKVSKVEGLQAFGLYHKALALASVGDFEGADKILSGEAGGPLRATRRGVIAHAEVLSQLERNADALELIKATFGDDLDPGMTAMRDTLKAGAPLPFTVVKTPTEGVAEVFFTVAGALANEKPDVYTLAYSRLAEYLRPGHTDAVLLSAGLLEQQGQFDLATEAYNLIPAEDPAWHIAELGRANALIRADKTDAAIEVLMQLAKARPELAVVWTTLGDTLRKKERFAEAADAYDKAVATFAAAQPGQWTVYFARGIARERQKQWPEAEADFRKALTLQPDQPQVLNYLGYSYLERQTNLEEALSMIERAVKAEPDSGYIVDSLGWGQYRMGRYPEALVNMEKAVELMPVDSVVNDHLGDVYWAVGRRLEAEFQWKRALSFEPDTEAEAVRIRRKLEVGLDAVLKDEGAEPLAVSKNGG